MLILATGKFISGKLSRIRMCLAALAGSMFSCVIFLPELPAAVNFAVKLGSAAVMTAIAFGISPRKRFFKAAGCLLLASVCYGGLMLALWLFKAPRGLTVSNGVVYIDIAPGLLVGATVACYTALSLAARFARKKNISRCSCDVTITTELGSVSVRGIIDTGNMLTEPFSGYPVIVAQQDAIQSVLPVGFGTEQSKTPVRVIPFSSVGGEGVLMGLRPRLLTVEENGKKFSTDRVYIGVLSSGKVGEGCGAIINPDAIN